MDLGQINEGWQEITLGLLPYRCRLLKLREWGEVQSWLKQAVPWPIVQAVRALQALKKGGDFISPEVRQSILDHAQGATRKWPPRVGSVPWIQALAETEGGTVHFIWAALTASGYKIDSEEAAKLEAIATIDEIANLIRVCLHGEPALPKWTTIPTTTEPESQPMPSSPMIGVQSISPATGRPDGPISRSAS